MASPYVTVPGQWKILETDSYRQLKLPIAPRDMKPGCAVWLNKVASSNNTDSWVEPAVNSPSGYATNPLATASSVLATYASTSATLAAEQAAFAALFMGIYMGRRTPRSWNKYLNFDTPVASGGVYYDSTAPFGTVVTSGIADVPYYDGTYSAVQAGWGYPVGTPVAIAGFLNASTYFTDASGMVPTATKYYLYGNAVMFSNTVGGTGTMAAANIIGRLVRNAKPGDKSVRIAFSSFLSVANTSQVAGVLLPG